MLGEATPVKPTEKRATNETTNKGVVQRLMREWSDHKARHDMTSDHRIYD